ncbi:hypothetical protein [Musicola keenii]|uniref:hypothetical protein n=1 Tax=Musicola keenii TaxID=2884250 RepID=UPI00178282B8|nr:hypothetical protein [Musicola keenii]
MVDIVLTPAQETAGRLTVDTVATLLSPSEVRSLHPWLTLNPAQDGAPWYLHTPRLADATGRHAAAVVELCRRFNERHKQGTLLYEYCGVPLQFRTPLLQSLLFAAPGFRHSVGIRVQERPLAAQSLAQTLRETGGALLYLSDPLLRLSQRADAGPVTYAYRCFTDPGRHHDA